MNQLIPCWHCSGTGEVPCECGRRTNLETIYSRQGHGSSESLCIQRCQRCGQLWKIRFQCDAGTGSDNIWLRPGEETRGYAFTAEEAAKYAGQTETLVEKAP